VDDRRTGLIVLLLGDPHLLECGKGGQDGASDPDGVLSLGRSDDLDLHRGWSQGGDLLLHSVGDSWVHGGTSGQDGVGVQIFTDIDVALHDAVVGGLVDTARFHAKERWLEEGFWASEPLVADGDDLSVGKFVGLLQGRGRGGGGHLLLEVEGDVAELLLDVTNDFTLGRGGKGITALGEDLHEIVSEVATGQVKTQDGVRKGVSLVDGDGVRDAVSGIEDDTGGTTRSVEGKDGLDGDVHGGSVEGLEHDLRHLLPVGFGVERSLREQDGMLFGRDSQFVVESVMPDLLHVVPVGDDTVLDGVFQGEDASLGLSLVSDVRVLLSHADHDALMTGASDDGGEDGSGSVVSGETGLAHTGSIVDNQRGNIIVTHLDLFGRVETLN
jgi:hypothetical protein